MAQYPEDAPVTSVPLGQGDVPSEKKPHRALKLPQRRGAWLFSIVVLVAVGAVASIAFAGLVGLAGIFIGVVVAALAASCVHIAYEWERVVILRFGRFSRVVESGLYFTIPIVEQVVLHVDQRINATPFLDERALTSDLAPVDVDAVVFWMVWDARQAYTQVADYPEAVSWSAQTALRDAIGRINLTDVPMKRQQIDHEIQESLEAKVADWGISIISVEIRDITVPDDLQDAMSKAAQAERERDARIMLAEAEKEISRMFVDAAEAYEGHESALALRTASLLHDGVRETGGMVVVPSSFAESVKALEDVALSSR